jgi:hypothetical protein
MEKMFGSMMKEFIRNMSTEDKQNMMSRCEKMAAMCPCVNAKEMTEEEKKKRMEELFSCCK